MRLLALAVLLLTVGCAPLAVAPLGHGEGRVCAWLRESVDAGAMPADRAADWYPECSA